MKTRKLFSVLAIFSIFAVAGCSDDDNGTSPTPTSTAMVKVVHASPDAPGVDLLVDDSVAGSNLNYPDNTGYLEVAAGTRSVKVNVTGTDQTVISADLELVKDKAYSVFAINTVSNLTPLVIKDNLATPESGNAHVRFIHLSPNAPSVDITLTDGSVVFGDVEFGEYIDFTPLPAGSYDLQVRLQGTDTVVLELPGISLSDQKIYTVFAKGLVGGNGMTALGAEIIVNK